jgi:predicted enzyme related to lactoylglutathione lyase
MQTTAARLSRLAPELPAADLRASIEYYVERLGFSLSMQMDGYSIVERDGVAIHLFADGGRGHSPVGVHIFTPELDRLSAELEARGAKIIQPIEMKPWGNREFRVVDVFGNELKLTEPAAE